MGMPNLKAPKNTPGDMEIGLFGAHLASVQHGGIIGALPPGMKMTHGSPTPGVLPPRRSHSTASRQRAREKRDERGQRLTAMRDYLKGAVSQIDQELGSGRVTPVDKELAKTRSQMVAKLQEMSGA